MIGSTRVEAANFVEVNQGAGITDDLGFWVSHFPGGPTRHPHE